MPRKPKKGYFVRGQFIAEGSSEDLELRTQLKGGDEPSKTDLKRESAELQKLGEALLTLRGDLMERLQLPEKLAEAVAEARRITNFEGKRRQLQYLGKLMRGLDEDRLQAIRDALQEQQQGSAGEALALHVAEQWRDRLVASEDALAEWLQAHPDTDTQQLRSLIRQARKDAQPGQDALSKGLAPRRGRAYREIFQLVKERLAPTAGAETAGGDDEH